MKLFLSKEILTTDKETAVLAVLNGMYSNKQEQLLVSVTFIGYAMCGRFLKSEKRQERTILEGIREALRGLAEKNIIEILDQDKDNYVLSSKGLEIDTSKENFTVVELWELQKIFQNTNKPLGQLIIRQKSGICPRTRWWNIGNMGKKRSILICTNWKNWN